MMGYAAQNAKDLLALARMLRQYAERHAGDKNHALFLSTATALEYQARRAASPAAAAERETPPHTPINVII